MCNITKDLIKIQELTYLNFSGGPKLSTARIPSSTFQDSVNQNPSMSPNETSMHPGFNLIIRDLSIHTDGMPPPLMHPRRKLSNEL